MPYVLTPSPEKWPGASSTRIVTSCISNEVLLMPLNKINRGANGAVAFIATFAAVLRKRVIVPFDFCQLMSLYPPSSTTLLSKLTELLNI
jgi:uncharacterized membrane protein